MTKQNNQDKKMQVENPYSVQAEEKKARLYSPFNYVGGEIIEAPPIKTIHHSSIHQLLINEQISDLDVDVLECIAEYNFLTASLLYQIFIGDSQLSKNSIKNKVKKYHKYGLIDVFYVKYETIINPDKSTGPKMFMLTEAASQYLKKKRKVPMMKFNKREFSNIGNIYSKMSLNQFEINAKHSLSNLDDIIRNKRVVARDLVFHLKSGITVSLISVKTDQRLDKLIDRIEKDIKKGIEVLLLVENNLEAIKLYKEIFDKTNLKDFNFLTDELTLHSDKSFKFRTVKLSGKDYALVSRELQCIGGDGIVG
ncbi:MAG: hypothetical protein JEZ08_16400 [Clostridiales bacterium]|nr:hypothetical protein [Clostridiales bacterium]